jgi:hypothetical protein
MLKLIGDRKFIEQSLIEDQEYSDLTKCGLLFYHWQDANFHLKLCSLPFANFRSKNFWFSFLEKIYVLFNSFNKRITFGVLWFARAPYEMTKIPFCGLSHGCKKNEKFWKIPSVI